MGAKQPDTAGAARISADASMRASELQRQSEVENRALQERLYNDQRALLIAQEEYNRAQIAKNQENFRPYMEQGRAGFNDLALATRDPNSWLNQKFTADNMMEDPGYQFRLDQGNQDINNSLAAKNGLLGGAALKATQRYAQDFASQEYGNAYSRFTNDRNNRYSALSNLANIGVQGAAGFQGASIPSQSGTQLSNLATNYGSNLSNIIQNGANTQSNIVAANGATQAQLALTPGQSRLGGMASGASMGASIGSIIPGVGTALGGVIGGLAGLL